MSKYRVVNFAGIPYGTPDTMQLGRIRYIEKHLNFNRDLSRKSYALTARVDGIKSDESKKQAIFIDTSVVDAQLDLLLNKLQALIHSVSNSDKSRLEILHVEQVIGRVARILNRPEHPTSKQKELYLDNLSETLKLAEALSVHDQTWNLRSVGRLLMWIAAVAAITTVVGYFLVASAPLAITAAVCSVFLGGIGLYLQKFSNAANLKEALSDIVHNVRTFPADGDDFVHGGQCVIIHDDHGPNGPKFNINQYLTDNHHHIKDYLNDKLGNNLSSYTNVQRENYVERHASCLKFFITTGFKQRMDAGDSVDELQDCLNRDFDCEKLAAISGIAIVRQEKTVSFVPMEELMAEGGLDPLGAEDPTEALQKAQQKLESQNRSFMDTFRYAANTFFSFFSVSDEQRDEVPESTGDMLRQPGYQQMMAM